MPSLSFRNRRRISMLVTLIALLMVAAIALPRDGRLAQTSFFTGITLLVSILLLVAQGLRRRLPVLRLGSASTWTQVHLYMGLFSAGVYVLHVPALIAGGLFESTLSLLFLTVTASGFYGIYASRTLPKRLTAVEGRFPSDRVDWHRGQIAETAKQLFDELNEQATARVLGGFYSESLQPYFHSQPSLANVLVPSGGRRRRLLSGLQELERYLEPQGRETTNRIAELVRHRDALDHQHALRLRLRLWLVIHGTLSVALIIGGILHARMVWQVAG